MRGAPPSLRGLLRGALLKADTFFRSSCNSIRAAPASLKGPPKGKDLINTATSLARRAAAANEQLGAWALREAPPAFRLRGGKYRSFPGGHQRVGPPGSPMEQQKKANIMMGCVVLSAASIVIFLPLYLNFFYAS